MEKDQAERALQIIRDTIQNTREDLAEHNWGRVWCCHAFTNAATFAYIGALVEPDRPGIFAYLVPLAVLAVVDLAIIAVLLDRDRGVRSFVERQMHAVWTTFVVLTIAGAGVIEYGALPPTALAPILSLNSAFGFAMMGAIFSVRFYATAVAFVVVGILCPVITDLQWYAIAALWWIALVVPGITLSRERQRRADDGGRTTIA